jgi:hypothetical protein
MCGAGAFVFLNGSILGLPRRPRKFVRAMRCDEYTDVGMRNSVRVSSAKQLMYCSVVDVLQSAVLCSTQHRLLWHQVISCFLLLNLGHATV